MQTYQSDFIADFKLGDNVVYNLKICEQLYIARNAAETTDKLYFNKPIILQNVSITEALMYDFIYRMKWFRLEGVKSLPEQVLSHFKSKKIDKLNLYIEHFKKHSIFDNSEFDIYEALDELRRLRNRVHIQNDKYELEADDSKAFNNDRLIMSEKCLELTVKVLSEKHSRPIGGYVKSFTLPYAAHFSN